MNDGGGGESSKDIEYCLKKRRRNNDEFAQAIARIAVAQVCESVGFQGFQQSALDTFADVACKYIREIGKTSNFYANLADLSLTQGFVGASDRDHCLSGSGIIKEISQYVSFSEEIGFAYSLPFFPVPKEQKSTTSFLQAGETPPTEDIPLWLPKFPDPKTYISMTCDGAKEIQMKPGRIEDEQKVLEPPSSKSEQSLARYESEFPVFVEPGDNAGRERANNPFLVVPLQPGEKEVALVSLPAKLKEEDVVQNHSSWVNHISTLDTFPPENQAVKNGGCDTNEGSRKDLSNNGPSVQVKFHIGTKTADTTSRHNDKVKLEVASWFVNDE